MVGYFHTCHQQMYGANVAPTRIWKLWRMWEWGTDEGRVTWGKRREENVKSAKGNKCSQYKSPAVIISSSLPICHVFFILSCLGMFWVHVMHARGIEGYVAYYLACLCEVTSAKHVWMSLEKICMGQMGRLRKKSQQYVLHSFPLAELTFTGSKYVHFPACIASSLVSHLIPDNSLMLSIRT